MRWIWDPQKDAINQRKHRLPLSVGEFALADPLGLSEPDTHSDGDRWRTLCVAGGVLFFVVHTWPDENDVGRIISVRRVTSRERRAYEHGRR